MLNRRDLFKKTGLVSLTPWVPAFLTQSLHAEDVKGQDRLLVVIQLDGGNDGLNTVIPYNDELYAKNRPTLQVPTKDVLRISDEVGLHPALQPAAEMLDRQELAIVQGVGYPNPNRSHFQSMAIWHHGNPETSQHDSLGWLGRALDSEARGQAPGSVFVGDAEVPIAIRGRRTQATTLANANEFQLTRQPTPVTIDAGDELASFVSRSISSSYEAVRQFRELELPADRLVSYPQDGFGQRLALLSKLIKMGGDARVFYVSQPGYDTHASQQFRHQQLLSRFANGLKAFYEDLRASGLADRVLVLAFSEFGRRVKENGSAGTDHGASGPVFVAGSKVTGGLLGEKPDLANLENGDLKHAIDFRRVYATVLNRWLDIDAEQVLGRSFPELNLLQTG